MATVASRTFRSIPHRSADQTWEAIVDLLTQGKNSGARTELLAVSGIAASIIADKSPQDSPIVVICDGPRTRIYCVYDDDAIEDESGNENSLGFDPLQGDWSLSLPCNEEDLDWVKRALSAKSTKITARNKNSQFNEDNEAGSAENKGTSLTIDQKGFLGV
jgi:hypothetical protein